MRIRELTEDQCEAVVTELIAEHHLETYEDMSSMLRKISIACEYMLKYNNAPLDDIERKNLTTLQKQLNEDAKMMFECDPYYR